MISAGFCILQGTETAISLRDPKKDAGSVPASEFKYQNNPF
jgi:hypothetical protein